MADSPQTGLWLMCSISFPTARSFSATMALGVGIPTRAPAVWSLGNLMTLNRGTAPMAESESKSSLHFSNRTISGMERLYPGKSGS